MRETLGYKATLRRGYAVVHGQEGVLTRMEQAEKSAPVAIEFADGRLPLDTSPDPKARRAARPDKPAKPGKPPEQGSLF